MSDDDPGRRGATIVDVAERAGVAIGTVSRYLNGHSIRRANREQITQAIADLGYRRNAVAAAMKTDLTNTVGFLVPSISAFHGAILERLSDTLRQQGRALLTYCHSDETKSVVDLLDFFDSHRVDCLVMDGHLKAEGRIREFLEGGTPVILYDNDVPSLAVDRVLVENRGASRRVVSHLLATGHTRIAALTGGTSNWTGRERFEGYREALLSGGIEIDPDYVMDGHWGEDGASSCMLELLSLPRPPTAVFCCNYNMAVGALRMIKEQGLKVPHDISLASFDDIPLFRLHETGITAIAQPTAKIADTIGSILSSRLSVRGAAHSFHSITLDCDVILRGSIGRGPGAAGSSTV